MEDEPVEEGRKPILASYLVEVNIRADEDANVVALTNEDVKARVQGIIGDAYGDGGVTVRATVRQTHR